MACSGMTLRRRAGFAERLARADFVVTGEGRFDGQSLQGKVTGRILELASAAGKPAVVFAGSTLDTPEGLDVRTIVALEPDASRATDHAAELLREVARQWASAR